MSIAVHCAVVIVKVDQAVYTRVHDVGRSNGNCFMATLTMLVNSRRRAMQSAPVKPSECVKKVSLRTAAVKSHTKCTQFQPEARSFLKQLKGNMPTRAQIQLHLGGVHRDLRHVVWYSTIKGQVDSPGSLFRLYLSSDRQPLGATSG